ncbi:hypothetical protein GCM10027176_79200 [Actinoallomurus bryophytorum]
MGGSSSPEALPRGRVRYPQALYDALERSMALDVAAWAFSALGMLAAAALACSRLAGRSGRLQTCTLYAAGVGARPVTYHHDPRRSRTSDCPEPATARAVAAGSGH